MNAQWCLDSGWNSRPLVDEVALVTGSLGGIGAAITRAVAAAGAAVAVHHLGDDAAAHDFAAELSSAGIRTVVVEADLTDWEQVASMVDHIRKELGGVSVLVNNAGIMHKETFAKMDLAAWRRTLRVDLDGVFVTTRQVLPGMIEAGRGAIINVASQLAFKGDNDYVEYSSAKGGSVTMTWALAREVEPAVRVNAIAPGPIETPMTAPHLPDEWVRQRTAGAVLRRLGRPEEIAPAVVFLASQGAELLHGQTLHLNGGGVMA